MYCLQHALDTAVVNALLHTTMGADGALPRHLQLEALEHFFRARKEEERGRLRAAYPKPQRGVPAVLSDVSDRPEPVAVQRPVYSKVSLRASARARGLLIVSARRKPHRRKRPGSVLSSARCRRSDPNCGALRWGMRELQPSPLRAHPCLAEMFDQACTEAG
eukprot:TRINITY_DN4070_c0_g2_i1.p1 TRINITY_DN4070_c0_g2~~TRINITY_DN4070_c0_g2_i1.p1  ORF type:complete len:162 (+),score=9.27 TRINITY_DN4070_c0_g2_i1:140-625(+)